MPKSSPLVADYLEGISVKAFEKYRVEITRLIESRHGVYALYKSGRLYYVGLASDLRRRVKQHTRGKHAGLWDQFSLYLVEEVDHIKEIETLLLRIANPKGNLQRGKLPTATNLKRRLNSLVKDSQRREREKILGRVSRRVAARRSSAPRSSTEKRPRRRPLKDIAGGRHIYATYRGASYQAHVKRDGRILFNGRLYDSVSAAAKAIRKKESNGWAFWRLRKDGDLVPLNKL